MATRLPGRLDLDIPQGTDWTKAVAVKDGAGALVTLTGWSAAAMVRGDIDDAAPALVITATVGSWGTGANVYNLELHIGKGTSSPAADWGKGRWDLELTDTFGNKARVLEGVATLSREVTR